MSLKGKTVILFGAGAVASGYARLFADRADNVVIVSRGDSCETLAADIVENGKAHITGEILPMHADATKFEDIAGVYEKTAQTFGRIDAVVNGSGGNKPEAVFSSLDEFIHMSPETSEQIMALNYLSKRHSLQLYARYLKTAKHKGNVVNITSMSGLQPLSKVADYSAAFAAIENLTKSMAFLYGKANIGRVNNLAVGFTIAEQNKYLLMKENGDYTDRGQEIINNTAQTRFLTTDDLAPHIVYLADEAQSGAINGHTLNIDGGFNLVGLTATAGY